MSVHSCTDIQLGMTEAIKYCSKNPEIKQDDFEKATGIGEHSVTAALQC